MTALVKAGGNGGKTPPILTSSLYRLGPWHLLHTANRQMSAVPRLGGGVLCYKPESCGFDIRGGDFFFNLPNLSGRTRPWGLLGF
jgi:hypothetical protein